MSLINDHGSIKDFYRNFIHISRYARWIESENQKSTPAIGIYSKNLGSLPRQELLALIGSLTDQMRSAAGDLQFELAARLRDEIKELKRELRAMDEAGI